MTPARKEHLKKKVSEEITKVCESRSIDMFADHNGNLSGVTEDGEDFMSVKFFEGCSETARKQDAGAPKGQEERLGSQDDS